MALALGPILERSFLQSLYLTQGNLEEILERPFAGVMLILAFIILVYPIILKLLAGIQKFNARAS